MTHQIGRNRNTNSAPNTGIHTVVGNVAEDMIAANVDRLKVIVSIRGENGWLRAFDAATDPTVRTGIFMIAGSTTILDKDTTYPGVYSVINDKNNKFPVFHFTEL